MSQAETAAAASLQKARIDALRGARGKPSVVVPLGLLAEPGWSCEQRLQGLRGCAPSTAAMQRSRMAQDGIASADECHRLIGAMRLAFAAGADQGSSDKSVALLTESAASILGETDYALAMVLLERMQSAVESSFGGPLRPSGAMLIWLTSEDQYHAADSVAEYASYSTPHVDQVNVLDYEISSLLYLNTAGRDFEGGMFAFNDPERDALVVPRAGRLLAFTSGFENLHQVQPVQRGDRFALSVWWAYRTEGKAEAVEAKSSGMASPSPGWAQLALLGGSVGFVGVARYLGW